MILFSFQQSMHPSVPIVLTAARKSASALLWPDSLQMNLVYFKQKNTFKCTIIPTVYTPKCGSLVMVTEGKEIHLFGSSDPDLSAQFNSVVHLKDLGAMHFVEVMVACPCPVMAVMVMRSELRDKI